MRPDEWGDPSGVEFLLVSDVTDGGGDTDYSGGTALPADARTAVGHPIRPRWSGRAVAVAAVLLLVGALAIRTATSHDHLSASQPSGATSAEPSPGPVGLWAIDAGTGRHSHRAFSLPQGVLPCPPDGCAISTEVPPAFLAAVAERLHSAAPSQQIDVTTGVDAQAWYRQITAAGPGRTSILVTVSKQDGGRTTTSGTTQTGNAVVGSVSHSTGTSGFVVDVQITGPIGWEPPLDAMLALAADPRVVATG